MKKYVTIEEDHNDGENEGGWSWEFKGFKPLDIKERIKSLKI
jgi:hypothetical protein